MRVKNTISDEKDIDIIDKNDIYASDSGNYELDKSEYEMEDDNEEREDNDEYTTEDSRDSFQKIDEIFSIYLINQFYLEEFHNLGSLVVSYPISWFITALIQFILLITLKKKVFNRMNNSIQIN